MLNLFFNILSSDINLSLIVDIVSTIASIILSIIAIIISIVTLAQNNKMIFESNKPNIVIFSKVISFTSPHYFIVLKNFGLSGAIITNIEYDNPLTSYFDRKPFEHMKDVFIAPSQSFLYPLNPHSKPEEKVRFKITYKYLHKIYTETCVVNFEHYKDVCYQKVHTSKNIEELSNVLQEMTIQDI